MDGFIALAVLLGLFYLIAPIVAIVMAVGHSGRLASLAAENAGLRARIDNLEHGTIHSAEPLAGEAATSTSPPAEATAPTEPPPEPIVPPQPVEEPAPTAAPPPGALPPELDSWAAAAKGRLDSAGAVAAPPKPPFDWERFIGVRLPVWLGALALSLAGFFFVRYSIEAGLLTPAFRVFAALIAAFGFLLCAEIVRRRITRDNGPAIAAAMAAAGVATLFATAYLASVVYELVPLSAGFVAMAAVTALSIAVALVFGRTVAMVGMLGGYLTPALIPSDQPSAAVLFIYLTGILVAMFVTIRLKDWWNIALVALLGPTGWIIAWAMLPGFEADHLWGTVFLIAASAVVLVAAYPSWSSIEQPMPMQVWDGKATTAAQAVSAALALSSLGFLLLLIQSGFILPFWQGLLAFSALLVVLTFIWPTAMRLAPLWPLVATALAMLAWDNAAPATSGLLIAVSAAIFGSYGLDQTRRLQAPVLASATAAFVALFFYLMALDKASGWQSALDQPHLWALGALVLATSLLALLWRFGPQIEDPTARDRVYAILASTVTAFVALVIVLEFDPLYHPAAAALQVVGLAYVHRRTGIATLRLVAMGLSAVYVLLILGVLSAATPGAYSFDPAYVFAPSLSDSPWVLLILPGLAFLGAGYLFRRDTADVFADCLDVGGIAIAAFGFLVLSGIDSATVRGAHGTVAAIALPELALAAVALYVGRNWSRPTLYLPGLVLAGLTTGAIAASVVLPLYTFWPPYELRGAPVFNIALLSLGLPSVAMLGIGWFIRQDARATIARIGIAISIAAVVFLYTLMILDIRHAFHPLDLQGPMSDAESYSYSIATLVFGAVLLVIGVAVQNLGARSLSFAFVLAATIKVFLFDAADLEGLWRVLSFFGMGLSFLAISWLYARFVFGLGQKSGQQPSPAT
jgi:uncharacterized membrane protein